MSPEIGTAIFYGPEGESWLLGVVVSDVPEVWPMQDHIVREPSPFDAASYVEAKPLQPVLPVPPESEPFAPRLISRRDRIVCERVETSSNRYLLFQTTEDVYLPFGSDPLLEPLAVRRFSPVSGAFGEVIVLRHNDRQTSLVSLAGLAVIQYRTKPDRFLSVVNEPVLTRWLGETPECTVVFPKKQLTGAIRVEFGDGACQATLLTKPNSFFHDEPNGTSGDVVAAKLVDGSVSQVQTEPYWTASRMQITRDQQRIEADEYTFLVSSISVEYGSSELLATRETYRGLKIGGFSHRILREFPTEIDLLTSNDVFITTVFGRDARIVNSATNHVSVVYEGQRLSNAESFLLRLLLSYLCGNRSEFVSTETFGAGGRLSFEYHERGSLTKRGQPPILLDPWSSSPRQVPTGIQPMLDRMAALRKKSPEGFDAVFHHYFEGVASSYSVSRVLMLAIAIDSLITLEMGAEKNTQIVAPTVFARFRQIIEEPLGKALETAGAAAPEVQRIKNKIGNLNNLSGRQKQARFWADLGVHLSPEESEVLETRHKVVHEGFISGETDEESRWDDYWRSNVLANLFNRGMLSLLGWDGRYLDATVFRKTEERDLKTPTLLQSDSKQRNGTGT